MKKLLLSCCLAVATLAAQANSVTVQNLLSVPITLYFAGVNPDGTNFSTASVTLNPGPTVFTDPTQFPSAIGAWTTGRITAAFGVCNPYDLGVGSPNIGSVTPHQAIDNQNLCNNGVAFDIFWNENNAAPYNAVILIF